MNINFLQFTAYQDDLISINNFDLTNDFTGPGGTLGQININLFSSYNGLDFVPQSMEVDTSNNSAPVTIFIDLYRVVLEPGSYFVRNIAGASKVICQSSEILTLNFYRSLKPERLIVTNRSNANNPINKIKAQYWGQLGNTLNIVYSTALGLWVWDTANRAPFNVAQDISQPFQVLSPDARRLHLSFYSGLILQRIAPQTIDDQLQLYYGTDTTGWAGVVYPNAITAAMQEPGVWYFDAPLLNGALYLGVAQPFYNGVVYGIAPPNGTKRAIGNIVVETYSY